MDVATTSLFLVVSAFSTNQIIMRMGELYRQPVLFWALEALNLAFGGYVLAFGLPGYRHVPAVGVVLGLMFLLHAAQNLRIRVQRQGEEQADARRLAREEDIRSKLVDHEDP